METEDELSCVGCNTCLIEPFIKCAECGPEPVYVCLQCFGRGMEKNQHESNHRYEVIKNDFSILADGWTAADELRLLKAVVECGVGNWTDICHQMRTKSKQECERHYHSYYLNNSEPPLPVLQEADITRHPAPIIFKLNEDPPRPPDGSTMQLDMAGYMCARGDFGTEHENYAELDLRDIDFESEDTDDPLERELKLAALDIYQNCLRERQRRKKIVRDYGLINLKKVILTERRHERHLEGQLYRLRACLRLMSPVDYDKYLEGLSYEYELRHEVVRLQEYRAAGLCTLRAAKMYDRLKARREEEKSQRHQLNDVLSHLQDESACQQWLQKQAMLDNISKGIPVTLPCAPRKSAPPLDIVGLPGYEKLSPNERELCASVRLVPESYNEFKKLLLNESRKLGSLKLAQARTLIKIDVNKTRKIYDFLVSEGSIKKD